MFEPGMTTLIISNEKMNKINKIVKSLEDAGLLRKSAKKTIENNAKEQKFISQHVTRYIRC